MHKDENAAGIDSDSNRMTEQAYWDQAYSAGRVRMRLPSRLNPDTRNFIRLMRRHVRAGMSVLELGCAPGKNLVWLAKELGASVAGIDYSAAGVATAKQLSKALGVQADLRCEDFFHTTFESGRFDLVYSLGVIEHFTDPRPLVEIHLRLLKPGGKAIITVPNYRGIYGHVQAFFNRPSLDLHNLDIMTVQDLVDLVPASTGTARAYPHGRVTPSLISWAEKLPGSVCTALSVCLNAVNFGQPLDVRRLCPWLVLEVTKSVDHS